MIARMRAGSSWPVPPVVEEATPPQRRRAWGKVSHEERFKKQRRALLRAAAKLASHKGYQAVRLSDIVTEAGLSKSTFYEHFESKEDCFVELHRRVSSAMLRAGVQAAEEALPRGAYETVLAVLRSMTAYVAQNPRLADVLREEVGASHPAVAKERAGNLDRMGDLFATVARRLDSPLADYELKLSVRVLVQGMVDVLPELRRSSKDLELQLETMARLACRGIGLPIERSS